MIEPEYPEAALVETSKPVGAVTKILVGMLVPLTVKLCSVEAVPVHAVNADNDVTLTVIAGLKTVTDWVVEQPLALL